MIKIDSGALKRLASEVKGNDQKMVRAARLAVREVSLAVEKRVKLEMPVDAGRARASWGHWTPGDLVLGKQDGQARGSDALWQSEAGGLTIVQGSNVPYIEALNAGHSRQAPAGFIDRAGLLGQLMLEEELGLIDPLSPEYRGRLFVATFG